MTTQKVGNFPSALDEQAEQLLQVDVPLEVVRKLLDSRESVGKELAVGLLQEIEKLLIQRLVVSSLQENAAVRGT